MARLLRGDRKAKLTQTAACYNQATQKSISESTAAEDHTEYQYFIEQQKFGKVLHGLNFYCSIQMVKILKHYSLKAGIQSEPLIQ